MRSVALAIALLAGACVAATRPAGGLATSTVVDNLDARALVAKLGETWGMTMSLPEASLGRFEGINDRYALCLNGHQLLDPSCQSVELLRIAASAPTDLAAARAGWEAACKSDLGAPEPALVIGEGGSPGGSLYTVRSFTVRAGVPRAGAALHTWKRVSRVIAVIPAGTERHVRCTGFIEREVTTLADPEVQGLLSVCQSLQQAP
jgi:hypothetical protein